MRELPPLDVHAHVATDINGTDLQRLGAVVLIATKSLADFELVRERQDLVSIWGVGCHPSLVGVQRDFDVGRFESALAGTAYVAEVGLDGGSRVPLEKQADTLRAILSMLDRLPRLVSLHSYKATGKLLDILSVYGAQPGRILHWWLGASEETERAIELGCYFSINYSMIRTTEAWKLMPLDRILTETDHPSGDRFSGSPRQPGRVQSVEIAIANCHGISVKAARRQVWENFARTMADTGTAPLVPHPILSMIKSLDRQ